jgi:electron transfer flavoprotein-quinone oxidoreductase
VNLAKSSAEAVFIMSHASFEVVVVGAGCAGLSAAIGLAKAGVSVAVTEAAVYPGAENWSGCVYFCENLASPELLGPEAVQHLAWERKLVQRGAFATNGHSLLGVTYRNPATFAHCYTVLRPIFDHHLAQLALRHGVVLLNNTTAESLLRDGARVVGVATNRGPIYAELTFLAEGDASHLVSREGYERLSPQQKQPTFLHGIKEIIDMPPGAIEENFGLKDGEGAAYEIILRNTMLKGRQLHLNAGGFLYTNRQSLSIGLVLPADHLHEHFDGDPNLLIEWFENLPDLQKWFKGGKRGVFGAKLIRGGGAKEVPQMVDEGLAIGGAASGLGVDFPYPNYTGPATRMGLQLVRAVKAIRAKGGDYTTEALSEHYLEPLKTTRYWKDMEFLRDWPGYVEKTKVFFGPQVDAVLGSAYAWTRPTGGLWKKWKDWLNLMGHLLAPQMSELKADQQHLQKAMPITKYVERPNWFLALGYGWLNTVGDWLGVSRTGEGKAGELHLHYSVRNGQEDFAAPPKTVQRFFERLRPALLAAAGELYRNDDTPLSLKVRNIFRHFVRQSHLGAVVSMGLAGLLGGWTAWRWRKKPDALPPAPAWFADYQQATASVGDLTPLVPQAQQKWDDRLGRLGYQTDKRSHIHVKWPQELQDTKAVTKEGLWHVCPAHVYEARVSPTGALQVVVNHENCIKCETCWRVSDLVDWGRDGNHRFLYAVSSPAVEKLLATQQTPLLPPPAPEETDFWSEAVAEIGEVQKNVEGAVQALHLVRQLDRKLAEYAQALAAEPRTIDLPRADYLLMLARYAQQMGAALAKYIGETEKNLQAEAARAVLRQLAESMQPRLARMVERVQEQRYAWAASEGRHLRQHHLEGLRRIYAALAPEEISAPAHTTWLQAEEGSEEVEHTMAKVRQQLDDAWGQYLWRELDNGHALTPPQLAALAEVAALVPKFNPKNPAATLHPPLRKALLAELGRRDPSLGYRLAVHLWARDLVLLANASWKETKEWTKAERWAAFTSLENGKIENDKVSGEAWFVPRAHDVLLLVEDRLLLYAAEDLEKYATPLPTLGLRGAGLGRLQLKELPLSERQLQVDGKQLCQAWETLSAADLIAIAEGMADQLTKRSTGHAASRVQFPGLFHDERSRDTIGKFGAIKKMLAEMGAQHFAIETLGYAFSPTEISEAAARQANLAKALVAELLGTSPGSLSYNAGQIFGGTGYSEDDILSKYYRDAAAWRFLGKSNVDVWHQHGQAVNGASKLSVEEALTTLQQRGMLASRWDTIQQWQQTLQHWLGEKSAAACELRGRLDVLQLATQTLLLRLHARMEEGIASEEQASLVDVWFTKASRWVDELSDEWKSLTTPASRFTLAVPSSVSLYSQFLSFPVKPLPPGMEKNDPQAKKLLGYNTGDYLTASLYLHGPQYVAEMARTDPDLAAQDKQYHEAITKHFTARSGTIYERYIEAQHHPDESDLQFLRQQGYFRFPIPKELGGEGRRKAEYYLLIMQANQYADATISLLIQANTSIGTTPILQARDKDLPKARKDIAPFVGDDTLQKEIAGSLENLLKLAGPAAPDIVREKFLGLQRRLEETVFKWPALKPMLKKFNAAWEAIVPAGIAMDAAALRTELPKAITAWQELCIQAKDYHEELGQRVKACDLALKWIASGQISAFALTEPSAGSDTARVATRAKPCSVPVTEEQDGALSFVPASGGEKRYILDAEKLEFRPEGVFYKYHRREEAAQIHFDEYDYETDDPHKFRYYQHGKRRVNFTDVAFLKQRDGQRWYDYWELTGAKMWITNGRMCGIMALYARTSQGLTAFVVDRHAEGLVIGKDEAKLGQNGSPTNEIGLQAVRVPKENVLGLEGRGQVNALETLNVGRAGLAVTCISQIRSLLEMCSLFLKLHGERPELTWRLRRMEEEAFAAESLAFKVIGQFEHPSTQSIRIESAVSKMLVSEWLHSIIERAEEIHGLVGQTQLHLVEKRKRDARIINIYEGTNEVQRFLIVKELVGEVIPRWQKVAAAEGSDSTLSPILLELLAQFRSRLEAANKVFGGGLWQNPNLQPTTFLLAEAAAQLLAMEAVAGRLLWLATQNEPLFLEAGQRAFTRCAEDIRRRLKWFDAEFAQVQRGHYATFIRAADLMFDAEAHHQATVQVPHSEVEEPLNVLVLLEPSATSVPRPFVREGQLLEAYWTLTEADQAALEMALRLRDQAPDKVQVSALAVGSPALLPLLREVAAREISTLLVQAPAATISPAKATEAVARILQKRKVKFDLLLGPAGANDKTEGLLAPLLASLLNTPYVGTGRSVAVRHAKAGSTLLVRTGEGQKDKVRSLPGIVALQNGLTLRPFTTSGYFAALDNPVETAPWPGDVTADTWHWLNAQAASAGEKTTLAGPIKAPAAAELVLDQLGIKGEAGAALTVPEFRIQPEGDSVRLSGIPALAVVAADADGRVSSAAVAATQAVRQASPQAAVLLLTPAEEGVQRKAVGALLGTGITSIILLANDQLATGNELRARVLSDTWPSLSPMPSLIVGEPWTETAFAELRQQLGIPGALQPRIKKVDVNGQLQLETARGGLRLSNALSLEEGQTQWLSLTEDAETVLDAAVPMANGQLQVRRWTPRLDRLFGQRDMARLLEELKEDTGLTRLADAEFIIDVGYGVGNRDGYEAVIEPLEKALKALGVKGLIIGGSRKVTEELHLLPADRQIGQSGQSVNPKILLAIGISGAPQHLYYIGPRATILCFNRDPEAPMMTLNQRQPLPKVYPIVGDLFQTVPAFIAALRQEPKRTAKEEKREMVGV